MPPLVFLVAAMLRCTVSLKLTLTSLLDWQRSDLITCPTALCQVALWLVLWQPRRRFCRRRASRARFPSRCSLFNAALALGFSAVCGALQELYDYLHQWAKAKPKEGSECAEGEKNKHKLTLLQWLVAIDHLALTAAVCPIDGERGDPIWQYAAAMCHKQVVLKVCRDIVRTCLCLLLCYLTDNGRR